MKTVLALLTSALALLALSANASESPFNAATLDRLLAAGEPVAVVFHADWCPTCRAQAPILKELSATRDLAKLTLLIADYDTELALRKSMHVATQSTIVVFSRGKEIARSTGDTTRDGLNALLHKAMS